MLGGPFQNIPVVTKNLLIINALLLLGTMVLQVQGILDLDRYLALHFILGKDFNPLQYITYIFMHGGISHLFFNMLTLWIFGQTLERMWGPNKFFLYFVLTGIGAGLLHTAVLAFQLLPDLKLIDGFLNNPTIATFSDVVREHKFVSRGQIDGLERVWQAWLASPADSSLRGNVIQRMIDYREWYLNNPSTTVVGASGSVYGILLAFGYLLPNLQLMLIFPPIPVKAKILVIIFGAGELLAAIENNPGDNVAHFAHLGGMLFGFILLKYWKQKPLN